MRIMRRKSVAAMSMLATVSGLLAMLPVPSQASPPDAHCTCRNRDGAKREVGQTACISGSGVSYMALCERQGEVATWRKLQDGCPEARLSVGSIPLSAENQAFTR